jgi:hypothetical protein
VEEVVRDEREALFPDVPPWLHEAHMDAANRITEWVCRFFVVAVDGSKPDGADVHEDVREDLQLLVDTVAKRLYGR